MNIHAAAHYETLACSGADGRVGVLDSVRNRLLQPREGVEYKPRINEGPYDRRREAIFRQNPANSHALAVALSVAVAELPL